MSEEDSPRSRAIEAVQRIQKLDAQSLIRSELGVYAFNEVADPAKNLISLYEQFRTDVFGDFPENILKEIQSQAQRDYSRFEDVLRFDPKQEDNPNQAQTDRLIGVSQAYQPAFEKLFPFINYTVQRSTDLRRLEDEARVALQTIRDETAHTVSDLEKIKIEADLVLEGVRQAAAEQGVSQQATFFRQSADDHKSEADAWHSRMVFTAIGLGVYAVATLFFHHIPWVGDQNAIQLAISKVLIFGVISYYLYICARNYLSHKHNAIIDRHRQNALATYKALVDAAGDTPNREVILVHAAACIFNPQSTGYTKDSNPGGQPTAQSLVEFVSRASRD